jgi:hypothetical protein
MTDEDNMSEMQERIAQALKDSGLREDHDVRLALATAAIKAMHDPSDKMLAAGVVELREDAPDQVKVANIWWEMIEAEL